jgi:hypothetical protein
MKKFLLSCLLVLAVLSPFSSACAANPARVEVLYMNHGPLMDTLDKMKAVFSGFGDKISVSWYDFESREGEDFKAEKGITQHVPLIIWIDGNEVVTLGQKQVKFFGFPTGAGPAFFRGNWTMDDLKAALDQATAER